MPGGCGTHPARPGAAASDVLCNASQQDLMLFEKQGQPKLFAVIWSQECREVPSDGHGSIVTIVQGPLDFTADWRPGGLSAHAPALDAKALQGKHDRVHLPHMC